MSAAKYDFALEQGSSFQLAFTYKDSSGNPVNLTGWCGRLVWKTNTNDISTFITGHNNNDYKFTLDGPNGKFTLLFPSAVTNSFNFNTAKYDIELQSPEDFYINGGNFTTRILYGTISVVKRYSQNTESLECQT